jgi:preprotein translocase subunit SecE
MNRQAKRMMQRQKASGGQDRSEMVRQRRAQLERPKKKRTSIRVFLKEVRAELRKVNWPTRKELVGYTIVVLVSVVFLTSYVTGLDILFSKTVLHIIQGNG